MVVGSRALHTTALPPLLAAAAALVVSPPRCRRRARGEPSSPTSDPGFNLTHLWAPAPAPSPTAAASAGGTCASPPLAASHRPPPETARSTTPTIPAPGGKDGAPSLWPCSLDCKGRSI
ncbi:unnamed protein product [Urochloa humidicola]